MKKLLLFMLPLLVATTAFSQTFTLNGSVADTTIKASLQNSVVALLRAKDSVLVKYARTNADGRFSIKQVPANHYVLMVSHPDYADYVDIIELKGDMDLGKLNVQTKAAVLQNVVIRGSAIRMKGDTMVYTADSFKVREGANVEDLLRRMPGIQVNAKGEITAQGEKVEKVLVDGEEFFGDDPTLATQNLIAKAVREVQVFDKKSDQAAFTGVDDGQKQKTINLKLKAEYKKGYFGKASLGGGLPNRWENNAMVNFFKEDRKLSLYGKMANTNNTGLGWSDSRQYGGGIGGETIVMDGMAYEVGESSGGGGQGLPSSWMAGGSYANKWNAGKNRFTGSYRYQNINTKGNSSSNTQYLLSDTSYFNNSSSSSNSSRWKHQGQINSEITIDSLQSLVINAGGNTGQTQSVNQSYSEALAQDQSPVNQTTGRNSSMATNNNFNTSLLWKKKFTKARRTLSVNASQRYSDNESDGWLQNYLTQYSGGAIVHRDTTDQKKINNNRSLTIDAQAVYTEPVGKKALIEVSYGISSSNADQKKLSYDKVADKYDVLNDRYSNSFRFNILTHKPGASYRYNGKKITLGLGGNMAFANWEQYNRFKDTTRSYQFTNIFPRANFSYKLGRYSSVRLNYNGGTQAPSIDQLQPVADNYDRTNIRVGNPNLKQAFNQNISMGYNFYQVLKEQGLWSNLYFSTTRNAFSSYDTISNGIRTSQTVNVNGNYNFGGWVGYNFKWKKKAINFEFNFNPSFGANHNFINGRANKTQYSTWGYGMGISKYKEKKYSISFNTGFSRTISKSSINPSATTRYWTITPSLSTGLELPKDFRLSSDANYNWRQKTSVFDNNNNAFIWNAGADKKIMKKRDMRLGFTLRDILNQSIGFNRNVTSSIIQQNTYNVLRRYWLITLSWNFNKGPKKDESANY